ncbi:MAG: hypothetical protein IH629_03725 [Thermoleophilia bacterium]|nr:hypothetical protein [Thermoleophilia bacterium]
MTGGTAYFLVDAPPAWLDGHETVGDAGMDGAAVAELAALLRDHADRTGSATARRLLTEPDDLAGRFLRVQPATVAALSTASGAPADRSGVARA